MLNIPGGLRRFTTTGRKATKLYGSIVTQARDPEFYRTYDVADTTNGRYELLALHIVLVLRTLRSDRTSEPLARAIVETFVADMDDTMREMSLGDMGVSKQVKRLTAGLMERYHGYTGALAMSSQCDELAGLLQHYFQPDSEHLEVAKLADYIVRLTAALDDQRHAMASDGDVSFPIPS